MPHQPTTLQTQVLKPSPEVLRASLDGNADASRAVQAYLQDQARKRQAEDVAAQLPAQPLAAYEAQVLDELDGFDELLAEALVS